MDLELLKQLVDAPGLPGQEGPVRRIVHEALSADGRTAHVDPLGNLVVRIPGTGPKVLIDAHMDEVGFFVQWIDPSSGIIRFVTAGGVDPRIVYGQPVTIHGTFPVRGVVGSVPPHIQKDDNGRKEGVPPVEDLFIDTGLPPDRVIAAVHPGDPITFLTNWHADDFAVQAKALDDRIGLFVMIEAIKKITQTPCDLHLVASVQEEAGLRGAGPVARRLAPDIAVALEGTVSNDLPGVPPHKALARLGKGPEIRLCDGRFIADRALSLFLVQCAQDAGIPHQVVVKKAGGTNAAAYQNEAMGARAAALSVPVRYIHGPVGIVGIEDIGNAVALLVAFLRRIGEFWPE